MTALRRLGFRLRRGLETFGPLGLARESGRRVAGVEENYAWYALDLSRIKPVRLAEGFELRLAEPGEVELLRELPAVPLAEGRRRVRDGVQLWFVLKHEKPAFACFSFLGGQHFPLEGAPRGQYLLPDGVACLENGLTSRAHRGRLIAPAAWTGIGERLRQDGFAWLITRAEVSNIASGRTLERTGFDRATVMHRRRRGLRTRIWFDPIDPELAPRAREVFDDLSASSER